MDWLNNIKPIIDFTKKLGNNNLTFLDFLLINDNNLEFKTHYKSTNKNDQIHFYLNHITKLAKWVEFLPMVQETGVQSHVELYQS